MKQISFILAVIFLLASCDKDKCTYTLGEKEYDLIPYEYNDTIIASLFDKNYDFSKRVLLVVQEGETMALENEGSFGEPLCKGTFDKYFLPIKSMNESILKDGGIEMLIPNNRFKLSFGFEINNTIIGFTIMPYASDEEKSFEFYPRKVIDNTTFNDVYFIPGDSDTLYYSAQTGLIKLIYPDGVIKFERE